MNSFFQKLTSFLEKEVAPVANRLDEDAELFREVYGRFVKLGCLNLLIPQSLGGLGGERREWIEYNILMAQYSGALLFLQAQHQFSVSRLKKLLPDPKVEEALRLLVQEERGIGLALAKTKTLLTVEAVQEGYRLSGTFRWTTGFGYFSHLLVSFHHEETLFYTLLPFQALQQVGGAIEISPKIETVVFNAIASNSVTLNHWLIPTSAILASHEVLPKNLFLQSTAAATGCVAPVQAASQQSKLKDEDAVKNKSEKSNASTSTGNLNCREATAPEAPCPSSAAATLKTGSKTAVEHPSIYNFAGVAKALLTLALQGTYGKTAEVQQRHALLTQAWENYYRCILEGTDVPLTLRTKGLELTEQCVLLARIACGSAGILKAHPLGRLIRETWQYTVAGYSQDQLQAYLKD